MNKIERHKFWMVWRENGPAPTMRHHSRPSAEKESERLAKANPDQVFFVLKSVSGVSAKSKIKRVRFVADPIPF